jgi:hypothetical protein
MSKTIADLRSDVSRKLHGTSINKVQGECELNEPEIEFNIAN